MARLVDDGIRGVTANPTIFAKAIAGSAEYDEQFAALIGQQRGIADAYWELVIDDVTRALGVLRPLYDESDGTDGFVSVEVAPELAHDTEATILAARHLHQGIDAPNLFVKVPATAEGIPAIRQLLSEGKSINITLLFGLERYEQVIDAYLSGLEAYGGDLRQVHSVASFFVSRVDTEVDRRLEVIGTHETDALKGKAGVAQAKLAYQLFRERFAGQRWQALAARGARLQRPLWASTSTKNPAYPDTLYVDNLIGPDTVTTLTEATIEAFEAHGQLSRMIDQDVDEARDVLAGLATVGIDLQDVSRTLEAEGVAAFTKSFDELLGSLAANAAELVAS